MHAPEKKGDKHGNWADYDSEVGEEKHPLTRRNWLILLAFQAGRKFEGRYRAHVRWRATRLISAPGHA